MGSIFNSATKLLRRYAAVRSCYRCIKMWFLRKVYGLRHVDPTFYMSGRSRISTDFRAGKHSFVGEGCSIGPKVSIGTYTMIAPRVAFIGDDHRIDLPGVPAIFSGRPMLRPTIVADDVWIGHSAIILSGVNIGRGAVIAAGAVVTKEVPDFEIHGGVPASKIGIRFPEENKRHEHIKMLEEGQYVGMYCPPK